MNSTSRASITVAALALVLVTSAGSAAASVHAKLTQPQLRKALLTLPQITAASGTGHPAQSSGITCAASAEISANVCYQDTLHSDTARASGAPWVTRLNILSFRTAAEARRYVAGAGSDRPQVLTTRRNIVVAFDPKSMISDGFRMEPAPEASVFQAVGVNAIWSACADPSGQGRIPDLVSCARTVATSQAKKLS